MTKSGRLVVADKFNDVLAVYGTNDTLDAVLRPPYDSVRKFKIGGIAGTHAGTVYFFDYWGRRIAAGDLATGHVTVLAHFVGRLTNGTAGSNGLWLMLPDTGRDLMVTYVSYPRLDSDRVEPLEADRIPIPREYRQSQMLAALYDWGYVLNRQDSLFLMLSGLDDVMLSDTVGISVSRVRIPSVRRRGIPPSLSARMAEGKVQFPEAIDGMSGVFGFSMLPDGRLGVVHADQILSNNILKMKALWLSVIDHDRTSACVDLPISIDSGSVPAIAWTGDTLVLVQRTLDPRFGPTTRVRRIALTHLDCARVPLRR